MFEFLVILAAILVAQVIGAIVGIAVVCSPKVMKLYAKKAFKMGKIIAKEMEVLVEEDEL